MPFILPFNKEQHLKMTTRLDPSIKSSPVWGFLPLRPFFSFTQNFPKPEISTSSPDSRVIFIVLRMDSIRSMDWVFEQPLWLQMLSTMLALVRDIAGTPCIEGFIGYLKILLTRNYCYILILSRNYGSYMGSRII